MYLLFSSLLLQGNVLHISEVLVRGGPRRLPLQFCCHYHSDFAQLQDCSILLDLE